MISPTIETKQRHIAFDIATHAGPEDIWTAYLEVPWIQGWELHCGCPPGAILFHSQYGLCNSHWEKKSYKCEYSSSPLDYPKFVPLGSLGGDYIYKNLQCRNRTAAWDWPNKDIEIDCQKQYPIIISPNDMISNFEISGENLWSDFHITLDHVKAI